MAITFRCPRYSGLRVGRGDGTYIAFIDGVYYATNQRDVNILRGCEYVSEDPSTAGLAIDPTMLTPMPVNVGVINWFSPLYGVGDGYGASAEQMILALERAGYDIRTTHRTVSAPPITYINHIFDKPQKRGELRIVYCPPHKAVWCPQYDDQPVLGFSMWEDSVLPPVWNEALQQVDAIAAPSKFCVDQFRARLHELGRDDIPVTLVPLGVQAEHYPFRKRDFGKGNEPFVVVHSSTRMTEERKGAKEAYEAFKLAFPHQRDVKLILRAKMGSIDVEGDPRVEFRVRAISDEEKRDLLYEAHALLYSSFGEGFGLIPLEAIASGLPAIVSDNTAMSDYRDLFYPIGCDPEPSRIYTSFQAQSKGEWYRPRVKEAAEHLRVVYENYQKASAFAAKAAKAVRKRWNYDETARALIEAIEATKCSFNLRHRISP